LASPLFLGTRALDIILLLPRLGLAQPVLVLGHLFLQFLPAAIALLLFRHFCKNKFCTQSRRHFFLSFMIAGNLPDTPSAGMAAVTCFGLHNLGNTCYLNALIQFLVSFKSVAAHFLAHVDSRTEPDQTKRILRNLIASVLLPKDAVYIYNVKGILQELHRCTADFGMVGIPDCVDMAFTLLADRWALPSLFSSQFNLAVKCTACQHEIVKLQPPQNQVHVSPDTRPFASQILFTRPQRLEGYKCDGCQSIGTSNQVSVMAKVPRVLVITCHAPFPACQVPKCFTLELRDHKYTFQLKAVVALAHAHYTTTAMRCMQSHDAIIQHSDDRCRFVPNFEDSLQHGRVLGFEQIIQ
jgi:hypothetical protein